VCRGADGQGGLLTFAEHLRRVSEELEGEELARGRVGSGGSSMTLEERIKALRSDEGVSPVIAVILMVAITVVLAATVYVWVSGFASEDTGPEQAAATAKGVDLDDNGDVEWIQVTLTSGQNAPYKASDVTNSTTDNTGSSVDLVCMTASNADCSGNSDRFQEHIDPEDEWDVGENLWIPCNDEGNHLMTFSVRDSTILDTSVSCDEGA
jgi:flagellin-like protein